jgi:hypothetical protein
MGVRVGTASANYTVSLRKLTPLRLIFPDTRTITHIAIRGKEEKGTRQLILTVFAPAIIYNLTGLPLIAIDSAGCVGGPFDPVSNMLFWGGPGFFAKESTLKLSLALDRFPASPPIDCLLTNTQNEIHLAQPLGLICPLHYGIASGEPFAESSIVTIFSHICAVNFLPVGITLRPWVKGSPIGSGVRVEPNQTVRIHECSPDFMFFFFVGKEAPTQICLRDCVHTTFVTGGLQLIDLLIAEEGVDLKVYFRRAVMPQPLHISNVLPAIPILGRDPTRYVVTIPPLTTMPFAFRDLSLFPEVKIEVDKAEFTVSLSDAFRVQTGKTAGGLLVYVSIVSNPNSTQSIIVTDDFTIADHTAADSSTFDLKVDIPTLRVAVITPDPYELALATFHHVVFGVTRNSTFTNFKLFVHSFKISDLDPSAKGRLEVVAIGNDRNDNYFLEFRASMFTQAPPFTTFSTITLDVQPIVLYVDIAFVSDMIAFSRRLSISKKGEELGPLQPAQSRVGIGNRPLTAGSIRCSSLSALVYVVNGSGRGCLYPRPIKELALAPTLHHGVNVNVDPPSYRDAVMNYAELQRIIARVIQQIGKERNRLIFGLNLVYPPMPPVGARFARTRERCHDNTSKLIASAAFQPIETIFQSAQQWFSMVSVLTGDVGVVHGVNQTAGQAAASGFRQAGKTLLGAVTGVVTNTVKESKESKHKAVGALKGLGKGMLGLVVKPVQAIAQAGAGVATATRKAIEKDEAIIKRERGCRVFPARQICEFTQVFVQLQKICATKDGPQALEAVFLGREEWAVLTHMAVWAIQQNGSVKWRFVIQDIADAVADAGTVTIAVVGKPAAEFRCRDVGGAKEFAERVKSKTFVWQKFASALGGT